MGVVTAVLGAAVISIVIVVVGVVLFIAGDIGSFVHDAHQEGGEE